MKNVLRLKSIENASVIRKFSVLFSLMSLLPFIALAILIFIIMSENRIPGNPDLFFWMIMILGTFSIIGFFSMRKTFTNLTNITKNATEIIKNGKLGQRINIESGDNEVTQLARTFNEVVQQLESNISQLEYSRNTLQGVLVKVASGVSSTENVDTFLDLILQTSVDAFGGTSGLIMIVDEAKTEMTVRNSYGLPPGLYKDKKFGLGEGVVGWVVKEKKPLLIPRLQKIASESAPKTGFEPPLISTPMIFNNQLLGAFTISGKKDNSNYNEDELIILSNLASQLALAVENSRLNANNQKTYLETITALALAVEARDVYSRGHSDRVGEYALKIAGKLGVSADMQENIRESAQLHDVGKIGITDGILRKPGPLNDFEREIMQKHPVIGEGIILPLQGLSRLRDPIRHHHEWLNGEGYPDRLKAEAVSLEARVLAVADSFDAMTTDRPYRKGMNPQQAKEELLKYKGSRYDPQVVDAFIECMGL